QHLIVVCSTRSAADRVNDRGRVLRRHCITERGRDAAMIEPHAYLVRIACRVRTYVVYCRELVCADYFQWSKTRHVNETAILYTRRFAIKEQQRSNGAE